MLAAEPADRPDMQEIRDALAKLAVGRFGDTTTVLLARTDLGSSEQGRNRTAAFPVGGTGDDGNAAPSAEPTPIPPARPTPTLSGRRTCGVPRPGPRAPQGLAAGTAVATPEPTPPPPARTPGRRRGRALWLLVDSSRSSSPG